MFEPAVARVAATRVTDEDLADLDWILDAQRKKIKSGRSTIVEDTAFHASLARATRNRVLVRLMETLNDLPVESRTLTLKTEGLSRAIDQGTRGGGRRAAAKERGRSGARDVRAHQPDRRAPRARSQRPREVRRNHPDQIAVVSGFSRTATGPPKGGHYLARGWMTTCSACSAPRPRIFRRDCPGVSVGRRVWRTSQRRLGRSAARHSTQTSTVHPAT